MSAPARWRSLPLLTSSSMKSFRRCPRLYRLRYIEGWRSRAAEAETLRFGTLMHHGLEAWWRAAQAGIVGDERLRLALAVLERAADPFEAARARVLLTGYHYRWEHLDYEVLAVEAEWRSALVNPATGAESRTWQLGGKIDAVVREPSTGRVLLIEHKTSSEDVTVGSAYWRRLRLDGQISVYFAGARALGYAVDACVYDVIKKIAQQSYKATPVEKREYTKPKWKQCPHCKKKGGEETAPHPFDGDSQITCEPDPEGGPRRVCTEPGGKLYANLREHDETPEEFEARIAEIVGSSPDAHFARGEIVRLEGEVAEHAADVWQQAITMRSMQVQGIAPRNPDACQSYGRDCDFWPVCGGETSLENPALYERATQLHPELSMPKEEAVP